MHPTLNAHKFKVRFRMYKLFFIYLFFCFFFSFLCNFKMRFFVCFQFATDVCQMEIGRVQFHNAEIMKKFKFYHFQSEHQQKGKWQDKSNNNKTKYLFILQIPALKFIATTISIFQFQFSLCILHFNKQQSMDPFLFVLIKPN